MALYGPRLVKYDHESLTESYVGIAPMGALAADPVWRIRRLTEEGSEQETYEEVYPAAWADRRTSAFEPDSGLCPLALDGGDADTIYDFTAALDGGSSTATYTGCSLDGGGA